MSAILLRADFPFPVRFVTQTLVLCQEVSARWLAWLAAAGAALSKIWRPEILCRCRRLRQPMTQIEQARAGVITPEMEFVAQRENLDPELVRSEVASGRMVIPANKVHLTKQLEPMGIGLATKCKINANIGNSAVTGNIDQELEKLRVAVQYGADTVMDLSTGKNIDTIRQAIIDASPVPIGTVPIYQMLEELGGNIEDMRAQHFLDMVEHQAKQGVDYMTVHCGVL